MRDSLCGVLKESWLESDGAPWPFNLKVVEGKRTDRFLWLNDLPSSVSSIYNINACSSLVKEKPEDSACRSLSLSFGLLEW